MPNLNDESTAIAQALVNDAHRLLTVVDTRDARTVLGTAVQLRRAIGFAECRLAALRRGLLHDLDVRLQPPRHREEDAAANPYRLVPVRGADEEDELSRLSDADLFEHTRHYYWWYSHTANPEQRWNISKRFSALRREVVARGHEHDAWTDGSEGEDA